MATEINHLRFRYSWLVFSGLALLVVILLVVLFWQNVTMPQQQTALQIRSLMAGKSIPDGFFVLRNLNQHKIDFASITLKNNRLQITFDSREQCETAKTALSQILPQGFVVENVVVDEAGNAHQQKVITEGHDMQSQTSGMPCAENPHQQYENTADKNHHYNSANESNMNSRQIKLAE